MDELTFYDLKTRKKFTSSEYDVVEKNGRRFAVALGENGNKCYRILGKAQ